MIKPLILLFVVTTLSLSACNEKNSPADQQTEQQKSDHNTKPDVAQERLDEGSKLWAEKKLDLAEAEFRKAVEEHPESAKAHARLAGFLLTQNKTEEAIPVYQEAITLDPENPKLFAALSIAYLHQSKFNMAKAMADEALRLNPEMEQVGKINEYIAAKQEAIDKARKADAHSSISKPEDHATTKKAE